MTRARRQTDANVADLVEQGSRIVATTLRTRMAVSPYATLGLGALAGYVLGGGLSPRLGSTVLRGVSRAMLADVAGAVVRGVSKDVP